MNPLSPAKRPVHIREDLLKQAERVIDDVPAALEATLVELIGKAEHQHMTPEERDAATCALWNEVARKYGHFAEEFSNL